jgi:hypothetical protein
MNPPDLPRDVLFQSQIIGDNNQDAGYRITDDGRYFSRRAGQPWQEQNRLTQDQLRQIQTAISAAGFADLDPVYRATGRVEDRVLWTQARIGSRAYHVAIIGKVQVPAIETLTQKLVALFQ